MSPTEALYLNDATLHKSATQLISIQRISSLNDEGQGLAKNIAVDDFAIVTAQTVFYPQGGGQPSDTGFIVRRPDNDLSETSGPSFEIFLVRKASDGTIFHFGRFGLAPGDTGLISQPQPPAQLPFTNNDPINLQINSPKREFHSRLHTAGHIIGLAMRLLEPILGSRKKVKANHFPGEASMEFEGLLYNEHKSVIQEKVNEIVAQRLPVRISWWDEDEVERRKEELDMVEGREVGGLGRVRIAEIGDLDANPCGGTHVAHTGETGEIRIRKIGRTRGVSRVSYEVAF